MTSAAIVLAAALSPGAVTAAAAAPTIRTVSADRVTLVPVSIEISLRPPPAFEVPPVIVAGAPDLFLASTGWSWLCRSATPVTTAIKVSASACRRFSVPAEIDATSGAYVPTEVAKASGTDWGRSYLGAFSAARLPHPWRGYDTIAVMHGENKNEKVGDQLYANSVDPVDPQSCRSGYDAAAKYNECYDAYNGFVSARLWSRADAGRPMLDLGPVLWSTMPYRTDDKKTSYGLRHPSAIVDEGYLYIFYTDGAQSSQVGRQAGLHVARMAVPADDAGAFGPAVPFFENAFQGRSLPADFDKERVRAFFSQPGSPATDLWLEGWKTARFAVSRVKSSHRFVGVEWLSVEGVSDLRLRVSDDLVHWSAPVSVPSTRSAKAGADAPLQYPVLTSLDGDSGEIDPSGFYLLGSLPGAGGVARRRISIVLGEGG